MTMTSQETRSVYAGDGSTTLFPIPYNFFGPDELRIYQTTAAGVLSTLVRGTDYTISGGGGANGYANATAAPAVGVQWAIVRSTTPTQQIVLPNSGPLPGNTLEKALDRLTALAQEFSALQLRTLRLPDAEAGNIAAMPSATLRANKVLTADALGGLTFSTLATGTVAVSSAMAPVINAATLAAGRQLLGARIHVDLVADHGADNTGAADCSAALQAAINSLTSGVVYLRPGSYKIAADVTLKPNVAIIADDPLVATLIAGANGVKILKYTAAVTTNAFTIRRVGFSDGGFTGVYAVHLDGTDIAKRIALVSLEDLYITGCARGLNLRFCANTIIEKVRCNTSAIGMYIDTCADTEVNGGWAHSGSDYGIYINGAGGAADEGVRITAFGTNNQVKGVGVNGQDWGQLTGCSLTTASGGPLAFLSATNWKVVNCDLATAGGAPATAGVSADASCSAIQIIGNRITINSYGVDMQGTEHVIMGNSLTAQTAQDLRLRCTNSVITGNVCASTGSAVSIVEQAPANYNNIAGNVTTGTVTIIGANTLSNGNNVVY
jgi:hypothetical protein